ncbi:DUF1620-domain-containing protein [Hanseniaspora valbyensis NRRL Y-1626]|uniref:ER membrane protein complex subunit 1 n=1 Tax=Hanseniaspora valbyensis NRRL Y-1626 TaxID=766949 RepID=A0A1B7TCF0_9ASCO|nr:DUF1620-domain-containing protein [Hanseniaspora valbyensis NRRL Y-1626]
MVKQIWVVVQITLLFFVSLTQAIFSDEAYVKDWHLQSIGNEIKHVLTYKNNTELIVLSKDNILSYLDTENGDILYRQEIATNTEANELVYSTLDNDLIIYNQFNSDIENVIDLESGLKKHIDQASFDINAVTPIETPDLNKVSIELSENSKKFIIQVKDQVNNLVIFNNKLDISYFDTNSPSDLRINFVKTDLESNAFIFVITDISTEVIYFLQFIDNILENSWKRDNSVADIVAFTIIDPKVNVENLPNDFFTNTKPTNFQGLLSNYLNRVSTSLNQVKNYVFIERKLKITTFILDLFTEDKSAETVESRNLQFGFTKYLIAANGNGLLNCINMNSGEIIWKFNPFFESKVNGLASDLENLLIVVTENGVLYKFDITNLTTQPKLVSKDILKESSISKAVNLGAENILIEYGNGNQEIISTIPEYKPVDEDVIIKFDSEANKIIGYSVETSTKLWTYTTDSNTEKIISFTNKHFDEQTSNVAITYSKKSLFKFLYQHLLAVASYNSENDLMTIDILDTKTGLLIKSIELEKDEVVDLQSPINLLFGEHWLVFSYKSLKPVPEQKIGIIELYEKRSDVGKDKVVDSYSYIPEPEFSLNTYIFPEIISSLSLTKTKYGVSSKNIIVKLANGQITTIPKFILNSRRKVEKEMTAEDKLEPFMQPYYQVIPINDQFVVSHERDLLSLEKEDVFSVATNMESTTYICDLNRVDLFCSKFAPSGEFDILQSNFQRNQIIFTVTVLAVAMYFVEPMVKLRQLKLKYYID